MFEEQLIAKIKARKIELAMDSIRIPQDEKTYRIFCGKFQGLEEVEQMIDDLLNVDPDDPQK